MKQAVDFNEEAVRPKYSYRRNPVYDRSFQILRWMETSNDYVAFGDYVVVDENEDLELSEKRVMNLISALNERRKLMDLGAETKSRTYYNVKQDKDEYGRSKVVFYTNTGEGVSKENAVFTFEGEVDDDA